MERRELDANQALTMPMIDANHATIDNVRLWDREPLLQTFGQLQEIRTYYDFVSVDDDRYQIDGELRQVLLSARELERRPLPTRTFINEHLTFTHGMGLTLGPSNQVTPEGLPVLFVKDLPPASSVVAQGDAAADLLRRDRGRLHRRATRQREFDYPAGEGDVYTTYDGRGGVPVGSFLARLLFAMRFQSLNILLSRDLTAGDARPLPPQRARARREGAAVPPLRQRSVPGGERQRTRSSGSSTLHVHRSLSVRAAISATARTTCATASRS